ncbi:hypothetical protein evm_005858 [Chilo suppressalis]|nr:hypothetical protein evm_005858 [Chilo suppressalis]
MARINYNSVLALLVVAWMVVIVNSAATTTVAPKTTTPAPKTTTPAPKPSKPHGILETIETFISAIPVGIATACETGAKAVESFFQNPWW